LLERGDHSVVLPSKCSSETFASALATCTVPSRCSGGAQTVHSCKDFAGVHDVAAGTCRYGDRVVALDRRAPHVGHDLALLNLEELVAVVVDLFAELDPRQSGLGESQLLLAAPRAIGL